MSTVEKNQEEEQNGIIQVINERDLADAKNLKKLAEEGEDGQYIALVDIAGTEENLKQLALKASTVIVTPENYDKEAKVAEQVVRNTRLAIQKIYKKNNSFLNKVKKEKQEEFEDLVKIIKGQEDRLYLGIKAIKDKKKAEKEKEKKEEAERVETIKEVLRDTELDLEKSIAGAKTAEDLVNYDNFLVDFSNRFDDFEEFDFDAKRLHAIYKARRGEVEANVNKNLELEQERKKLADEKQQRLQEDKDRAEKAEQMSVKIMEVRAENLALLGMVKDKKVFIHKDLAGIEYKFNTIKDFSEIEYFDFCTDLKKLIKKKQEEQSVALTEKLKEAKSAWFDLVKMYKDAGGTNASMWTLRKDEIPSKKDIEQIKTAIQGLNSLTKKKMLKLVTEDIKPVKDGAIRYLEEVEGVIKNAEFKNENSKLILENFLTRVTGVVNEVFGEVYSPK